PEPHEPLGMQGHIPSGEAVLGSDGLFEAVSTYHEASPSGLTGKRNDKKHVVVINKRRQPITDLND
ncbi:MAG: hypothetical protein WBE10_06910, partial [Candidatus Acidiferrum sp.]